MIYRKRGELTILQLQDNEENIFFDRLKEVMFTRPSNTIYFERDGKLHGIVTMGDVQRACIERKENIVINTHFMHLKTSEYMKAKKIFDEKQNINALPVLDDSGILMGDWLRWDDLRQNKYMFGRVRISRYNGFHVAFVSPCNAFVKKQKIFDLYCKELISLGLIVDCIKYDEIAKYVDTVDYVLVIDEDEYRALCTLWGYLAHLGKVFVKLCTYMQFRKGLKLYERIGDEIEFLQPYLSDIESKGIKVFNLIFEQNECYKKMLDKIQLKWIDIGKKPYGLMHSSMYKEFFGDLYTKDDIEHMVVHLHSKIAVESASGKMKNCKSRFLNVYNGERYTADQPSKFKKTVYFVGPCLVYGSRVEDKNTIESFLQRKINECGYEVKVVNYGSPSHGERVSMQIMCILNIPLKKGDIIVLHAHNKRINNIAEINLTDALEDEDIDPGWMIDEPRHCNDKMNDRYANIIFEIIRPFLSEPVSTSNDYVKLEDDAVKKVYLDRYFAEFDSAKYSNIGSIVMNCNPFTYGHRYLIEQALNIVDCLIIFVVEEDRSLFTFDERFAMVREGVADLKKVIVVPSGPFILSQTTFPEYFIKSRDEDLVENVEKDITLFAEEIAPQLKIKYRFVGEEPEDEVTNEYNLAMKRILPEKDIALVEIPRKKLNEEYISASKVRKCLAYDNRSELKKLVPESTLRVLFEK